jgi:site-specific recombinase XerD
MLNSIFTAPWLIQRAHRGPLGPHTDKLASLLLEQGYSGDTVEAKMRLVLALSGWLAQERHSLTDLDEQMVESFLRSRLKRVKPNRLERTTMRLVLDQLRLSGDIPPPLPKLADGPLDQALADFKAYLVQERGLSKQTIGGYLATVGSFLSERFGKAVIRPCDLRQADTNEYLQGRRAALRPATFHGITAALRSYFTFLHVRRDTPLNLAAGVPAVACWRLSTVPKFIKPDEIRRLLASCDRRTIKGQRDYTILLLLARLGLRAGEVVAMRLDDIHWESGEMLVRGKGQRHDRMPIPRDVGVALAKYLRSGRPRCSTRQVFVRLNAPHREFVSSSDISTIVRQAIDRTGLHPATKGAHLLRHSLATNMLQKGASLTEIGEVLRHRCPVTTELYSKVALGALRTLAQPWPKETP